MNDGQKIQFRRGTSTAATANNKILADGEPGYEKNTGKLKIGDGVTAWNLLPYFNSGGGSSGVTSVNTKTGAVTLIKDDIGLANVDNTSDANKPVSTAQAAADAQRVSKSGDVMTGALQVGSGFAASFVGDQTSYINAGNNSALMIGETSKPISISVRFNLASDYAASAQKFLLICVGRYYLRIETSLKLSGSVWGGTNITSTTTLVRGTTYEATFTYDGTTAALYVNGVSESSLASTSTASGSGIVYVGIRQGITGSEVRGTIDTPRIWNRSLTSAEVLAIASNGAVPQSGLVLEIPLDDKTVTDNSSISNIVSSNNITYVTGLSPAVGLDSSSQINIVGSAKITGAINAAFINAPDRGSEYFNVKAYGAKGNGVADDITKLQAAVNAAGVSGGTVFFPGGTYKTTATLIVPSNVSLLGSSLSSVTITGNFDSPLIGTTKTGTSKTVYSNISVENIKLVSQFGHGFGFFNVSWLTIKGCEVSYTNLSPIREAMWVQYCQYVVVDGNYLHALTGNGIQINATDYFQVVNNHVAGGVSTTQDDGIDIDTDFLDTASIPSRWGVVSNNTINNIPNGCSIRVEDSSYIAVLGNSITNNNTNGAVAGININESATAAANSLYTKHIVVSGNTISNSVTSGISTSGVNFFRDVLITGNILENCGQAGDATARARAGILLNGPYVTANDNYLYNCGINNADSAAILVYKSSNQFVTNNTVINSPIAVKIWNGNGTTVYTNVQLNQNILRGNTVDYAGDLTQAGVKAIILNSTGQLGVNKFTATSAVDVNGTVTATAFTGDISTSYSLQRTSPSAITGSAIYWVASAPGTKDGTAYDQGDILVTSNVGGTSKTLLIMDWSTL